MKRISSILATFGLALTGFLAISSPAFAHSDELETNPAAGAVVEAGRIPITLTFGEPLLTGDDSIVNEIVVTNENSEIIPALCAVAENRDLSTAAAIDQPGEYTVTYRVVSEDGHPVSGSYKFKVENTTDYSAAEDPIDACVYAMATSGEGEPLISPAPVADDTNNAFTIIALIAATTFVVLLTSFINRAKSRKSKSE